VPVPQGAARAGATEISSRAAEVRARREKREAIVSFTPCRLDIDVIVEVTSNVRSKIGQNMAFFAVAKALPSRIVNSSLARGEQA